MVSYINVHAILDARRRLAKASTSDDPESSQVLLFDDLVVVCYIGELKHLVLNNPLNAGT